MTRGDLDALLRVLAPKRRVFVSYHHGGDRAYYAEFSRRLSEDFEAVEDNSVDRLIDSDDADYVIRTIRENYVTGTSCTLVLCGAATPWRKFVDWEIKATLDACHGLIGVNLPTNPRAVTGSVTIPDRLYDNIETGYAIWETWHGLIANPMRPCNSMMWAQKEDRDEWHKRAVFEAEAGNQFGARPHPVEHSRRSP